MSSVKIYIGTAVTFTNPNVAPTADDPSVVFKDGYYYYCKAMNGGIGVAKTERLQDIGCAPLVKVYTAPAGMSITVCIAWRAIHRTPRAPIPSETYAFH